MRSSDYLEDPATEFDTQGLELDWREANFRHVGDRWSHHAFRGRAWQNVSSRCSAPILRTLIAFCSRARQGMVIYIPTGNVDDPTRDPTWHQGTVEFMQRCGLLMLPTDA